MSRLKSQGRQSETEREFCEILQMADPIVSRFVSEHEAFRARNEALVERVAVLERALEQIAQSIELLGEDVSVPYLEDAARAALDG